MVLSVIKGDLMNATEGYIVHQCNCETKYAYGLSKTIFSLFPWSNCYTDRSNRVPGKIDVRVNPQGGVSIINLFGQNKPGKPSGKENGHKREQWFQKGLEAINLFFQNTSYKEVKLAFPYRVGCGLAGGDWSKYYDMLDKFQTNYPKFKITLYANV